MRQQTTRLKERSNERHRINYRWKPESENPMQMTQNLSLHPSCYENRPQASTEAASSLNSKESRLRREVYGLNEGMLLKICQHLDQAESMNERRWNKEGESTRTNKEIDKIETISGEGRQEDALTREESYSRHRITTKDEQQKKPMQDDQTPTCPI
ncbi:hypothetical protein AVEN_237999-1 [Araneus ventricosus]|uniref:Uncharacterized protein n=1 Tax=Araneus ventricosus TaxID=182803 RepID=A0A4Y2VGU6_ARAVE|nr:hypothetical protein AVEN_237999-1 [Araneus ventricosus]